MKAPTVTCLGGRKLSPQLLEVQGVNYVRQIEKHTREALLLDLSALDVGMTIEN